VVPVKGANVSSEFIEGLIRTGFGDAVRSFMDGNECPPWARPNRRPGPRTPEEEARDEAADNPFLSPSSGLLPHGDCMICGGRYGHDPACPEGIEARAAFVCDPKRIAVMRRFSAPGSPYDPVEGLKAQAQAYDAEDDPDGVRGSRAWADHFRRAASLAEEILAAAPPTTTPEPDDGRPAGETALQYLDRPAKVKPPAAGAAKKGGRAAKGDMFGGQGAGNYGSGV
jgi:hypothetical protein